MSIAAGITRFGRSQAEALMQSTCEITRVTGTTVDPATGLEVKTTEVVWSGVCRLRYPYVRPQQVLADGQQLSKNRGILWVPVEGTGGIAADDVATITASDLDPDSVGMKLRVESQFAETHATSRRLPIEVMS